ncbi:MAG: hypothetical protein HZA48_12085 [Planctomycetes bacterium]|nr:hypothetical protein [Planctomycetota bacterium]
MCNLKKILVYVLIVSLSALPAYGKRKKAEEKPAIKWCQSLQELQKEAKDRQCPIIFVFCDNTTFSIIKKEIIDNPDMIKDSKKFSVIFANADENRKLMDEICDKYKLATKGFPEVLFSPYDKNEIRREFNCVGSGQVLYSGPGAGPYMKDFMAKALTAMGEGLDADSYDALNEANELADENWEDMNYKDTIETLNDALKIKAAEKFLKPTKDKLEKLEKDAKAEMDSATKKEDAKDYAGAADIYARISNYEGFACAKDAQKKLKALKNNADAKNAASLAEKNFNGQKSMKKAQRLEKNGDFRAAMSQYQQIAKLYPDTQFAEDAEIKIKELKNK